MPTEARTHHDDFTQSLKPVRATLYGSGSANLIGGVRKVNAIDRAIAATG